MVDDAALAGNYCPGQEWLLNCRDAAECGQRTWTCSMASGNVNVEVKDKQLARRLRSKQM